MTKPRPCCDAFVAKTGALEDPPLRSGATRSPAQGTVGLEWEEDLARLGLGALDTVLVAVGGGGLIAGVATWFAGRVKVVGVEPEGSRALHAALAAGKPLDVDVKSVAADLLGARRVGDRCFAIAKAHVAEVALPSPTTPSGTRSAACGARCA